MKAEKKGFLRPRGETHTPSCPRRPAVHLGRQEHRGARGAEGHSSVRSLRRPRRRIPVVQRRQKVGESDGVWGWREMERPCRWHPPQQKNYLPPFPGDLPASSPGLAALCTPLTLHKAGAVKPSPELQSLLAPEKGGQRPDFTLSL